LGTFGLWVSKVREKVALLALKGPKMPRTWLGSQKAEDLTSLAGPSGPAWSLGQWILLRKIVTDHDRGFCFAKWISFSGLRPAGLKFWSKLVKNWSFFDQVF